MANIDKYKKHALLFLFTFVPSLALYTYTLLPDMGFWDIGEFQTIAYSFDIAHPTGYPIYIVIGKLFVHLFPVATAAWRMNFLSALFVSTAIFITGNTIFIITKHKSTTIALSLFLAVNPVTWNLATAADPHSLHLLFASLFVFLSVKVQIEKNTAVLPYLSLVTALALSNHLLSIYFVPSLIVLFIINLKKINMRIIIRSSVFVWLGISFYALLPIISYFKPPLTSDHSIDSLASFIAYVSGSDFQPLSHGWVGGSMADALSYYASHLSRQFIYYTFILPAAGLVLGFVKYPRLSFALCLVYLLTVTFSLRYQNAALDRYFASSFLLLTIWSSMALSYIAQNKISKFASSILFLILALVIVAGNYNSVTKKGDSQARDWAEDSLTGLPQNASIISWWSYSTPLWYLQRVEKVRTDVNIINTDHNEWEERAINEIASSRKVYLIEAISMQNENYSLSPSGNLFQVVKNK